MAKKAIKSFYEIIERTAEKKPEKQSFFYRTKSGKYKGRSFGEIKDIIDRLIAGFIWKGVKVQDKILLLCDPSPNWIITDLAIVAAGAVSVPRGTDVTDDDIEYIVNHADCKIALVQHEKDRDRLLAMKDKISILENVYVIEDDERHFVGGDHGIRNLLRRGRAQLEEEPKSIENRTKEFTPEDLATLIYTSGTTGAPKGVMLNQAGWIQSIRAATDRVDVLYDDKIVSLLPPWHVLERIIEYLVLYHGLEFLISEPTNIRDDLSTFNPDIFPSVPRIWESVYSGLNNKLRQKSLIARSLFAAAVKVGGWWRYWRAILFDFDTQVKKKFFLFNIVRRLFALVMVLAVFPLRMLTTKIFGPVRKALGTNLRLSIAGGSALPAVVDQFFSAVGITVVEGYGMTETSALISTRPTRKPTAGTVGIPISGYELKLKDDQGTELAKWNSLNGPTKKMAGSRGTLWVKSDQILQGYYKRDELNDVVFDSDGFFDTGDLMTLSWRGELLFAGRSKDTLALAGGENVEPVPIEDKLLGSDFIDQVMVVGDDQKTLGVLIVPDFESIKGAVTESPEKPEEWNNHEDIRKLYKKEIQSLISTKTGFKSFEVIPGNAFCLLSEQFNPDTEMTRTFKMKRPVIKDNYKSQIEAIYK
jgi:long-chain acyl-CoA synthetase